MSSQESSGHVKAAIVGGIFAVIAACIGGAFLIINTLVAKGFIIIGPSVQAGNPSSQPTVVQSNLDQIPSNRRTSCLSSSFESLGSNWSGRVSESVSQGTSRTYSHCPPELSIHYIEMGFDDDLSKVVIVCPSETTDVTASFYRLDRPNEILPVYRSSVLTVPDGCRIDFTVIDTLGGNIAMHFSADRGE